MDLNTEAPPTSEVQHETLSEKIASEQPQGTEPSGGETPKEPLNLDSVERFRWNGKEWTPKDLQKLQQENMTYQDYTRKTQQIAEERRFISNLDADIENCKNNPALIAEFKKIYPPQYHRFLRFIESKQEVQNPQATSTPPGIDPQLIERFNKMEQSLLAREQEAHQQAVSAFESELDQKAATYSKKYPMADEEAVLARAQVVLDREQPLTDKVWDDIWKSVHDKNEKIFKEHYSKQFKQQQSQNTKGKDMASGGAIPAQAPKSYRTIKEASEAARQWLENS